MRHLNENLEIPKRFLDYKRQMSNSSFMFLSLSLIYVAWSTALIIIIIIIIIIRRIG